MDIPVMLQLLISVAVLVHASVSDASTRRVSDIHWAAICAAGIPLAAVSTGDWVGAAGSAVLAVYMLSPRLVGSSGAAAVLIAAAIFAGDVLMTGDAWALSAPLMFAAVWVMYRSNLIPGGADAKCLMSLALTVPRPECFDPLLLPVPAVPPVLPILLTALLMSCSVVLVNLRRSGLRSASGYSVPISEADPVRELPMQKAVDGRIVRARVHPGDSAAVLRGLREAGAETVEVSPLIPFIVPLTVAYVLVAIAGDPFAALFRDPRRSGRTSCRPAR